MPRSSQYDVRDLSNLAIPFDTQTKELDNSPRIVSGTNTLIDLGGRIRKRPAVRKSFFSGVSLPGSAFIARTWIYKTIEATPKVYILASIRRPAPLNTLYAMYYVRLSTSPSSWTSMGNLRALDESEHPHEVVVANGLAYIKSYPRASSGQLLGGIIFDGTDATTDIWGVLPPSSAITVDSQAGWSASTNSTDILFGWTYVCSYVTTTGHISSRSPLATPTGVGSLSPSNTGPFSDLAPEISVPGNSDTTNIPSIIVWRSTDGGDNFFYLDTISNTGSGSISYTDNQRDPSSPGDPQTDFQLDPYNFAPGRTTNDPPPTTTYPNVTGTDAIEHTTPPVEYASRIWFGINNVLVFSGYEEILNGNVFESYPSGLNGNSITFKNPIRALESTNEALYIFTSDNVLWLRGTDRQSFTITPLISDVGFPPGNPKAVTSARDVVAFITHDYQVGLIRGSELQIISIPLKGTISDAISSTTELMLTVHAFEGNAWLLVGLRDTSDTSNSRIFCYDINRRQWNTPWAIPVSAMCSGQITESDPKRYCLVATEDSSGALVGVLDLTSNVDQFKAGDAAFSIDFTFNLMMNQAGNHIHDIRNPAHHGRLAYLKTERTKFSSDTDPTVEYRLDDFSASLTAATQTDPPYMVQSSSHKISWWPVYTNCQRAQVKISKSAVDEKFELQTFGLVFQPEATGSG